MRWKRFFLELRIPANYVNPNFQHDPVALQKMACENGDFLKKCVFWHTFIRNPRDSSAYAQNPAQ